MQLERPFVVDDNTGDFCELDPSVCPQCKRPGAFEESQLPPLSAEKKTAVENEARVRREEATQRQRERSMQRLNEAPRAALEILHEVTGDSSEIVDRCSSTRG